MAELAARIKSKYPQYQSVPDEELEQRIVSKYPQYTKHAGIGEQTSQSENPYQNTFNRIGGGITETIGRVSPALNLINIARGADGNSVRSSSQAFGEGVLGAANTATLGIPKFLASKALQSQGLELPKPKSPTAETVGGAIGLLAPGLAISKGVRQIPALAGRGVAKTLGRGATEGAILGAVAPPAEDEDYLNPSARVGNAAIGAGLGVAGEAALSGIKNMARVPKMIQNFKNVTSQELPFVEKMATAYKASERGLGTKFGQQLDDLVTKNPGNVGSAGEAFANLKESIALNPSMRATVNKRDTPITFRLLNNPNAAEGLTAKQMQEIINELSSQTTVRKLQGLGVRPSDNPFLGVINDFRDAQLSAFPEMAPIRAEFRTGKTAAKNLKPYFQEKALPRTIRSNFDDNVVVDRDLETLFKDRPEILEELRGASRAGKTIKRAKSSVKSVAPIAGTGAIGLLLAKILGIGKD